MKERERGRESPARIYHHRRGGEAAQVVSANDAREDRRWRLSGRPTLLPTGGVSAALEVGGVVAWLEGKERPMIDDEEPIHLARGGGKALL